MEVAIPNWILVFLVSLLGYFLNKILKDIEQKATATALELKKHIETENEIPKSLILERIDNLCVVFDEFKSDTKEHRKIIQTQLETQHNRQDKFNDTLIKIVSKV